MPRFLRVRPLLGLVLVVAAVSNSPARGGLVTNLSVTTTPVAGGLTLYDYTLTDESSSTLTASSFFVAVNSNANLSALTAPNGWDISYTAGDSAVGFTSPDPSLDIMPGTNGMFSFESVVGPEPAAYLVRGIDPVDSSIVENTGVTLSAVPEPSSALLCVLGVLGLLGFYGRSRRHPAASVRR